MEIKTRQQTLKPVNISEWNDEVKAFVRSLDIMERITFNDLFIQYHARKASKVQRAEAGLSICIMCLVGEDGQPLFTLDDMETLKAAAFEPIARVINATFGEYGDTEEGEETKNS